MLPVVWIRVPTENNAVTDRQRSGLGHRLFSSVREGLLSWLAIELWSGVRLYSALLPIYLDDFQGFMSQISDEGLSAIDVFSPSATVAHTSRGSD